MSAGIPNIKLNNGLEMPVFGLDWQGAGDTIKHAIDIGYRLFDCAYVYDNEGVIGEAIQEKIREGVIKRENLFIVSKLSCNSHRPDLVEPLLQKTLKNLQTSYIDLYLIHRPMALHECHVDYVNAWKAMEQVYRKNLTRAIGVSNFDSQQIEKILNVCTVVPQVSQVECHPYLNQLKLRRHCEENGIAVMSYGPLGGPVIGKKDGVLTDPRIEGIAKRYKKTPAQIVLRYNTQLGNIVTFKSTEKNRLLENLQIFDFYLAPEDMFYINTFSCNV